MSTKDILKEKFGNQFENDLIDYLDTISLANPVIKGQKIISKGQELQYIVLLLSGIMKVSRTDENGNEHILFYLKEGESCAATFAICETSDHKHSEIDMEAETNSIVLLIPRESMHELLAKFEGWRKYVLKNLGDKIVEFLNTLDHITFKKLDERLLSYLQNKAKVLGSNTIEITHQDIANELATSRVVISRLLKMLERDGLIKLHRNRIEILS